MQLTVIEPAPDDIMPFRAWEATLDNGLRVIAVPTGFPNLVSLQVPVLTGSRNEVEPGKSGFAHFFEHMMFRGTPRFSSEAYQAVLTRAGARHNAYTTDDYTNYHITFAREDLETVLDLEADRFMNLAYSEADFRTEARAILGEYNKSAADPLTKLIEVQRDHAFTTHTYRHTTMGFIADIEAMPEQFDYSRTFFERWYRPGYAAVVVAGDIDPEATIALVERYWGKWAAGKPSDLVIPAEPAPTGAVSAHVPWASATLPWLSVGFHGPAFSTTDPSYAALDVVLDLFFGETSRVYQDLVEQRQLVDQLFPYGGGQRDPGLFTIFARLKRAEDAAAVRDAIVAAVEEARAAPVSGRRLAEAKSNLKYSFARTLDNSESIAATLARFVRYERSYSTLNELFRRYDALTPDDLHRVARETLTTERLVFTTLSHGAPLGVEAPAIGAGGAVGAAAAFPVVKLASPSPLLRFKLLFAAGSADDPAGKEGLAALSAAMLADAGSTAMRIDEINKALFPMAGSLTAQVDREMTTFTAVVHRDNAGPFLDIVLPQLLAPGYREEDFARLREVQRNELVQDLRSNNEEELGKELLQAEVFRGTPYGHPVLGTVAGIEAITLEDVRGFAAGHFTQARLTLGATGDIPEEVEARVVRELAALPVGEAAPGPRTITPGALRGMTATIVEKETRSTAISFGHPIPILRDHPDFAALWLARAWLGEHRASSGRLFQRIREVRGMNYGNYAYIEAFPRGMYQFFPDTNLGRRAQIFEVWIRPVPPGQAVFALKAAVYELRSLITKGLSEEDFADTRDYLMKNVFVMTKTQDQQLGYALDSRWYGMGEFVETMRAALNALTREKVNEAVRRYLSAEDLHAVLITKDAAALREELLSGRFTPMTYESEKPKELLDEDRRIGTIDLQLMPEHVSVVPVDWVFAR